MECQKRKTYLNKQKQQQRNAEALLKEDHKNNFRTKNQEDSWGRLEVIGQKLSKLSILAKKMANFGLKWPKFCQIRIFPGYRV